MGKENIKDVFKHWIWKNARQYGEFGLPLIAKSEVVPKKLLPFNYVGSNKLTDEEKKETYIHFFIDDYQFERVWNNPKAYLARFKKFGGIIMPDFSVYQNFPKALQIYNVFKSRMLSFYYQENGIDVITNVTWSNLESLDWTLDGLPKNSVIALSSNGVLNKNVIDNFIEIYNEAIKRLEPTKILIVGRVPKEIQDDRIITFESHSQRMERKVI